MQHSDLRQLGSVSSLPIRWVVAVSNSLSLLGAEQARVGDPEHIIQLGTGHRMSAG